MTKVHVSKFKGCQVRPLNRLLLFVFKLEFVECHLERTKKKIRDKFDSFSTVVVQCTVYIYRFLLPFELNENAYRMDELDVLSISIFV